MAYHDGNSTIAVILLNSYVSRENFDGKNFMKKGWVRQKMHLCFLWWLNANSTESLAEIGFFFQNKPFAAIETSVKVTVEYNAKKLINKHFKFWVQKVLYIYIYIETGMLSFIDQVAADFLDSTVEL